MMRIREWHIWALLLLIPLSTATRAADAPGTLDKCLAAAAAAQPGIITGWQELSATSDEGYYVRIVTKNGDIKLTECRPTSTAPLEFTKKTGLVRYQMYERTKAAESVARAAAPVIFVPPVRITRMELSVSMTGTLYYTYTLALPGGEKATVEVDGTTGKPTTAKVTY
jgi:hypothetical protein